MIRRNIWFRARALADGEIIYFQLHQSTPHIKGKDFFVGDVLCEGGTEEQYIGRSDANGNDIYEGDILGMPKKGFTKAGNVFGKSYSWCNAVVYSKKLSAFVFKGKEDNEDIHDIETYLDELEVVGNMRDNRELLYT